MKLRIKSQEDFWAGLMFIGFGIAAIVVARDYPMGSAMRMGPGYFPTYLGAIMAVLGAVIAARSTRIQGDGITPFAWRPLVMLCVAFIVYFYRSHRTTEQLQVVVYCCEHAGVHFAYQLLELSNSLFLW